MKEGKKWYKKASNWLIIAACIVLIPILIINLWIIIESKTNSDKVPSVFGIKPFIVLSGSMENEIHKGDLIITKVIDPNDLEVDDVIAFRDGENTVTTHRIIQIEERNGETLFITKGDNNKIQDRNLVEYKDIEGIYIMRIPGVGKIMNKLSEPTTFIVLVLVITVVFGICFIISNKRLKAEEQAEFLEYKKMKAEQAKKLEEDEAIKEVKSSKSTTKKKISKK